MYCDLPIAEPESSLHKSHHKNLAIREVDRSYWEEKRAIGVPKADKCLWGMSYTEYVLFTRSWLSDIFTSSNYLSKFLTRSEGCMKIQGQVI